MLRWFVVVGCDDFRLLPESFASPLGSGGAVEHAGMRVTSEVAVVIATGHTHPVFRVDMAGVVWAFRESPSVNRPLSADDQARLEMQWLASKHQALCAPPRVTVTAAANGQAYLCDVHDMTQLNLASGGRRKLSRSVVTPTAAAPPPASPPAAAAAAWPPSDGGAAAPGAGLLDTLPPDVEAVPDDRDDRADDGVVMTAPPLRVGHRPEMRSSSPQAAVALGAAIRRGPFVQFPGAVTDAAAVRDGRRRLVLPSISTSVFKFDLARAAAIATREIATFLAAHAGVPDLHVTLIDYSPTGSTTDTIRAFAEAWNRLGKPDVRFTFAVGDIASAATRGRCFAIVNAANKALAGGASTSGWNRAVFVAAGEHALQADTRARHTPPVAVGPAYDVPLRPESPLRTTSGTHHVIHVVGPNMNPSRADCLYGDYARGDALLRSCYQNALQRFGALAGLSGATTA